MSRNEELSVSAPFGSRPPALPPNLTCLGGIGPDDGGNNLDRELLRLLQGDADLSPEVHDALKIVLEQKRLLLLQQIELEQRIGSNPKQDRRLYDAYHDALLLINELLAKL